MWGWVVEDREVFKFEWPTQDDWAAMDPRVKFDSIEFRREWYGSSISSVKVNLSNG